MEYRAEKDSLGTRQVPADVYYGIQTLRAVENFPISGRTAHVHFIWATAAVKCAAAAVNREMGLIDKQIGDAIVTAATEVMQGRFHDQFVVDVYQAGAGTSHHMNANEVIANRAIELLGGAKGDYSRIHPNDHVNFGQSTNDVFPTAMRLAILRSLPGLVRALYILSQELANKGREFSSVVKSGRTHLQDAVPVTLGQEFEAWSVTVQRCLKGITNAAEELKEMGIGGSAAGTGLNTHPEFRYRVVKILSQYLHTDLKASSNLFEAMQSMRPFAAFSGALKECALELIRIANDMRLLASGPTTGLNEITLPPVQPGSSIMPGKVNPVMAEMLNMVCFQVAGYDATVTLASQAGQLELNVMMPVIIHSILDAMTLLGNAVTAFTEKAVTGIVANEQVCRNYLYKSLGLATVLNVVIGYDKAAEVMKKSLNSGKTVVNIIEEEGILSPEQISRLFDADLLTQPGVPDIKQ
ncbi:MAG TPA: aspartate ammonia-lyase [bacterium]|nr:aspartate ammonia-lyase [bacterium]HPN44256.1 aspartate ammonia-lyase [bacterium]